MFNQNGFEKQLKLFKEFQRVYRDPNGGVKAATSVSRPTIFSIVHWTQSTRHWLIFDLPGYTEAFDCSYVIVGAVFKDFVMLV